MMTRITNFLTDAVVVVGVTVTGIGVWLLASEVLITFQKLDW